MWLAVASLIAMFDITDAINEYGRKINPNYALDPANSALGFVCASRCLLFSNFLLVGRSPFHVGYVHVRKRLKKLSGHLNYLEAILCTFVYGLPFGTNNSVEIRFV